MILRMILLILFLAIPALLLFAYIRFLIQKRQSYYENVFHAFANASTVCGIQYKWIPPIGFPINAMTSNWAFVYCTILPLPFSSRFHLIFTGERDSDYARISTKCFDELIYFSIRFALEMKYQGDLYKVHPSLIGGADLREFQGMIHEELKKINAEWGLNCKYTHKYFDLKNIDPNALRVCELFRIGKSL